MARRVEEVSDLAEEVMAQRGADRIGETVDVLIEERLGDGLFEGRAAHQAPEVDGTTTVRSSADLVPGQLIRATVVSSEGVDLVATAAEQAMAPAGRVPPASHLSGSHRLRLTPLRLTPVRPGPPGHGRAHDAPGGPLAGGSPLTSPGSASPPPGPSGAAQRPSGPAPVPAAAAVPDPAAVPRTLQRPRTLRRPGPCGAPGPCSGPGLCGGPGPCGVPDLRRSRTLRPSRTLWRTRALLSRRAWST